MNVKRGKLFGLMLAVSIIFAVSAGAEECVNGLPRFDLQTDSEWKAAYQACTAAELMTILEN